MYRQRSLIAALSVGALLGCDSHPKIDRACTAPRGYWQQPHNIDGLERPYAQVSIDHASSLYLQGRRIGVGELEKQLRTAASIHSPEIDVFLDTEMGADCRTVEATRDLIDRTMNCRSSNQCAEGSREIWRNWPAPPGTPPS